MRYYEYWGLKKPPFDNVPDPSMYVSCHTSSENAIAETLFAIEEGNDCISVIVGDVGLGKTLSLRVVIDSIEREKYRIAFVVNPDLTFVQLLKEIIGQLTGRQCELKKKADLLEAFNKLLFDTMGEGKKILIIVDEANAMPSSNLEKLRLLTNLQPDENNLFTIVLAGQIEFAKKLAHPKRANLFQRIGTYCTLEKMGSKEMVRDYVEARLALAGGTKKIFTDEAIGQLWEYSEYGVPRLINKICKLSLKAGETNRFEEIGQEVVRQIGERFQRLGARPGQKTTAKKRQEKPTDAPAQLDEPRVIAQRPAQTVSTSVALAVVPAGEAPPPASDVAPPLIEASAPGETAPPFLEAAPPTGDDPRAAEGHDGSEEIEEGRKVLVFTGRPQEEERREESAPAEPAAALGEPDETGTEEKITVSRYGIDLGIPFDVVTQFQSSSDEHRVKLAGVLAAQAMKKHPQLTAKWGADPLVVWSEIREVILTRLTRHQNVTAR
ncbi:MAG: AAA family ATPase [Syntrophorhabdales bacterium]|jgi:general secretion pathway protein A